MRRNKSRDLEVPHVPGANTVTHTSRRQHPIPTVFAAASFMVLCCNPLNAQQTTPLTVSAYAIGGQVKGANGPEAGVWVIAETSDLPTKFAKVVVTNDQGQF